MSGNLSPDSTSSGTLRIPSRLSQNLSASRSNTSAPRFQPRASLREQRSGPGALWSPQRTGSQLPLTAGEQSSTGFGKSMLDKTK